MANVDAVFIDTNILVYANLAHSPFHHQAKRQMQLLDELGCELWISRQVLKEYLSAMTRRSDLTGEIPITSLAEDVRYFASCFHLAEEDTNVTSRLLSLMEQVAVGGKQVHDANIVATMQVYNIHQLLTHNTDDFNRFSQFITVLPLETQA
jgi:predicted nucleic acid-binding protein